jgi:hypothetical protein
LACCSGQCPDPHHWCRFSHQFWSSHQLLAQPTVQSIMFLSATIHSAALPAHGPVWPSSGSASHLQDLSHVLLYQNTLCCALDLPYSGLHKVTACMDQTSQISKHGSPSSIGCWSTVSICAAANHVTVTTRPPPAQSLWAAAVAGTAHLPAPQTICAGHHICFQLTIGPEQPSLHGMMCKVPPCYIIDTMPA